MVVVWLICTFGICIECLYSLQLRALERFVVLLDPGRTGLFFGSLLIVCNFGAAVGLIGSCRSADCSAGWCCLFGQQCLIVFIKVDSLIVLDPGRAARRWSCSSCSFVLLFLLTDMRFALLLGQIIVVPVGLQSHLAFGCPGIGIAYYVQPVDRIEYLKDSQQGCIFTRCDPHQRLRPQ